MSTAASNGNTLTVRPTPFLHNHLSQPDANLPMHGDIDMALGQLPSATSDALTQGPRAPVVTTRDDSKASSFEAIPRAAIQQDANEYYVLGCIHEWGAEPNDGKAFKYFQLAADQGHRAAQYNVGLRYRYGRGVEPNDGEAFKYIQLAADQGLLAAQYDLGAMYEDGRGLEQNDGNAFKYFQLAADQGHDVAQYNVGFMCRSGRGVEPNDGKAFNYFQLAADQGLRAAQYAVGVMYRSGRGVEPNNGKAFKYFQLAADQGHDVAQFNLALAYENGRGAEQNYVAAAKYYQLAADQGLAQAQSNLGSLYKNGRGVAQSNAEAVKYYRLAADQGRAIAQNNLGFMYQNESGVAQSDAKAVKYYRLAADQGLAQPQRELGTFYRDGKGVPSDAKEALRCFWKANRPTNVIDLSGLGITDTMLQHLPALFEEFGGYGQTKERPPVRSLNLSNNPITDNGAQFIALILKHSKTLTKLTLEATAITDHGMKLILDALKNYNVSVVDCEFSSAGKATKKTLDELIGQNRVIEKIMDGMDTHYPMDIPKTFDVLPMDVLRQLLQTIAVAHAKNPAPSSLSTTISSMLGHKPATTKQAMDEVYTALMSDPASASLKEKQSKNKPNSHLIHFVR